MDKKQRIFAAIKGETVDRPPISFWRHFPEIDHDPIALADILLRFHQKFDLDFIKVMPSGVYCVEDWGCQVHYTGTPNGAKTCREHAIKKPQNWEKLKVLPPHQGALGRELKCLQAIRAGRKDSAPILQTLFSPLTIAAKLSGPDLLLQHLRTEPEALSKGLDTITEAMIQYGVACREAGADGFFYATQMATRERLSLEEHKKFAETYDLRLLNAFSANPSPSFFILLHIHGEDILFQELSIYPVQAINWHDRKTWPTLGEGKKIFSGAVVGGLEEWGILRQGPASSIREQVKDAIAQAEGKRLIIAPGCGLPIDTPEEFLQAARRAVEEK
jgi:uroporphyrinogen decarboxylase